MANKRWWGNPRSLLKIGNPRSGNSAKIGLVGVLGLIVLVVALWDDGGSEKKTEPVNRVTLNAESSTTAGEPVTAGETATREEAGTESSEASPPVPFIEPEADREQELGDGSETPPAVTDASDAGATEPTPPAPVPAAPVKGSRYTTKVGDSLWRLAQRYYGDGNLWEIIASANGLGDHLPINKTIVIPERRKMNKPLEASATPTTAGGSRSGEIYTVEYGDSLWKIAKETLGDGESWPVIYEANREILPRPEAVRPGMKLRIPRS